MNKSQDKMSRREVFTLAAGMGVGLTALSMVGGDAVKAKQRDGTGVKSDGMISLPAIKQDGAMSVEEAINRRRSERNFRNVPLEMAHLSQLLWAAQGITDPHPSPAQRFLRAAPSAGALYPLDTYVVAGLVKGLETGVYHYLPQTHALRMVAAGDVRRELAKACLGQFFLAQAPATLVITAEYIRITGRYGKRGIRYAHMEVGHAGQNLHLQAETLGLGTVMIGAFRDKEVASTLALPSNHEPLYVMPIGPV